MKNMKKGKGAASKRQNELKPLTDEQRRVVEENLPLAKMMSRKYAAIGKSKGIDLDDLLQEACFGLCLAVQNYDSERGAAVKTYAFDYCRRMVLDAIDAEPESIAEDVETLGAEPIDDDDEAEFEEIRSQKVKAMMAVLNASERKVVELTFGFRGSEKSIKEVALIMHVQMARIREIYNKALIKMEMLTS